MLAFGSSGVNFYALRNLVVGVEKGLEVELLPNPALGWGEKVPKASHTSWKPRLRKTFCVFSLCIQIIDKFVGEMEQPVEPPSFCAVDGGSGWEGRLTLGKAITINLSEEQDGWARPALPLPAEYLLHVIAF